MHSYARPLAYGRWLPHMPYSRAKTKKHDWAGHYCPQILRQLSKECPKGLCHLRGPDILGTALHSHARLHHAGLGSRGQPARRTHGGVAGGQGETGWDTRRWSCVACRGKRMHPRHACARACTRARLSIYILHHFAESCPQTGTPPHPAKALPQPTKSSQALAHNAPSL